MYVEVEIFYCLKLAFDSSDLNFVLGKRHIPILSTRNVMWTLGGGGGGGLAPVTVLGEKSWKISMVC